MKRVSKKSGSLFMALLLCVSALGGSCVFASAEEETELVTEAEAETEAVFETLEFTAGDESLEVENATGLSIDSVAFDEDESAFLVTEDDGSEHIFSIPDLEEFTGLDNLRLTGKLDFIYLSGVDEAQEEQYYYENEDADEIILDEPVTMYTVGRVNVREKADGSSDTVGTVELGDEVEVLGGTSSWFLIESDDMSGYVAARYLSTEEADAETAVAAEENARAAIEAEAAAAAAAAAAAEYSGSSGSSGSSGGSSGASSGGSSNDPSCLDGGVLY